MPDTRLIPAGSHRAVLEGLSLPSPPPTRIYISGNEYLVQAPHFVLPPLPNAVKFIIKYALPGARIANNVMHLLTGSSFVTSDPASLQLLADKLFSLLTAGATPILPMFSATTFVNSVTVKDIGGTTAQAVSSGAAWAGTATGSGHPPQVACTISWKIAESYRGGKPRTYVPTPPVSATSPAGSAIITPAFAATADTAWTTFMTNVNSATVTGGGSFTLGSISYQAGHAVRPTPLFRQFLSAQVHERLDSQRRRSGPESAALVTPA